MKAKELRTASERADQAFETTYEHAKIKSMLEEAQASRLAAREAEDEAAKAEQDAALLDAEAKRTAADVLASKKRVADHAEDEEKFRGVLKINRDNARRDKLKVVFKSFDLDNDGGLNENEFFECGKVLFNQGDGGAAEGPKKFEGFDVSGNVTTWTREQNNQAWAEMVENAEA